MLNKRRHGPTKCFPNRIAMSEIVLHYALSKLTKTSDILFQCFQTS